jgi:hypothetical protein
MMATIVLAGVVGYAPWRGYDTWPVADRHQDRRAAQLVTRMTTGLDDRTDLFAERLNWQVENALLYETRYRFKHVTWIRVDDFLLHFPFIVRDNHATGRDVVLTSDAMQQVSASFGSLLPIVPDPVPPAPSLLAHASRIPRGALYVLAILTPTRDEVLDPAELADTVSTLTGGRIRPQGTSPYEIFVGRVGEAPIVHRYERRPFRQRLRLPEGNIDIRLDGWLPSETFRRAGFGHVTLDRRPILTIERGVSLAALDDGEPFYAAGVYMLQPRFRIPRSGLPQLALLH